MLKKLIIAYVFFKIATYLAGGLFFVYAKNQKCNQPSGISINKDVEMSKEEVGNRLMKQYLNYHVSKKSCFNGWLRSYEINDVKTWKEGGSDSFNVNITYSVRPFTFFQRSYWRNGDGYLDKWGWIKNRNTRMDITEEDNQYVMSTINP